MYDLALLTTIHNGILNFIIAAVLGSAVMRTWVLYKLTDEPIYLHQARVMAVVVVFFFYLTVVTLHGRFMAITLAFFAIGAVLRWLMVITGWCYVKEVWRKFHGTKEAAQAEQVEQVEKKVESG